MVTKIQKWGNSLALRIPKSFAAEARVGTGSPVDLNLRDGCLVISPVKTKKYRLNNLLDGVSKRNLHGEVNSGASVGREAL